LLALLPDAVAEHVFERQDRAAAGVRQRLADRGARMGSAGHCSEMASSLSSSIPTRPPARSTTPRATS
jgi:hypothetical protein